MASSTYAPLALVGRVAPTCVMQVILVHDITYLGKLRAGVLCSFPVVWLRNFFAVEEKQQTRIPLKDEIAGAAPVDRANLKKMLYISTEISHLKRTFQQPRVVEQKTRLA